MALLIRHYRAASLQPLKKVRDISRWVLPDQEMDVILHDACVEDDCALLAGDAPEESVQESSDP